MVATLHMRWQGGKGMFQCYNHTAGVTLRCGPTAELQVLQRPRVGLHLPRRKSLAKTSDDWMVNGSP